MDPLELTCERLTNSAREGVKHYPHKCGKPAARYRVTGGAFFCYAVLCSTCKKLAEKQGLILEGASLL
jgi:hypothetical protein